MNMKYKCIKAWKRHSLGQIIDQYEYKRLPYEIKPNFVPNNSAKVEEVLPIKEEPLLMPKEYKIHDPEDIMFPTVNLVLDNPTELQDSGEEKKITKKLGRTQNSL